MLLKHNHTNLYSPLLKSALTHTQALKYKRVTNADTQTGRLMSTQAERHTDTLRKTTQRH